MSQLEAQLEVLKDLARVHPEPARLLRKQLAVSMRIFVPKTNDQALDFFIEHLLVTTKMAAMVMSCHISDHPAEAKECVPHMDKTMPELFKFLTRDMLQELCEHLGYENPLQESGVNEKTREEILGNLKRGNLHA